MDEENKEKRDLKPKREKFCQEYIKDFNGARAARDAGYSEDSAKQEATRLLSFADVQDRIKELEDEALAAAKVTPGRIIQELAHIAFADITDAVEWSGRDVKLKPSKQIPHHARRAISEVSQTKGNNPKKSIKFHDKAKALEALARIAGMNKDNLNLQGKLDGAMPVQIINDIPRSDKS